MTHNESLLAIEKLALELLASSYKDPSVLPHKWHGIKRLADYMAVFVKAQGAVQTQRPAAPIKTPVLPPVSEEVAESPRELLATTEQKPNKRKNKSNG